MNKNALKIFAINARKELIEKIQIKAMQYGIYKDNIKGSIIQSNDSVVINGKPLTKEEKHQREKLIIRIKSINESGEDGYNLVIEEVAYTWFNRFTALRFMEINDYLPTRVRTLSSSTGSAEPELIKEANNVNLPVDKQKIYEMKLNSDIDGLFKYMIIAQCNDLNKSLKFMFEKIGHYTELLFPDGLLNEGAFIRKLTDVDTITESDWKDIEIIGWLYQYYISEEKDRVIQAKKKYKKDEIPFATQLFTPDWIVRYMVQNSLGRYWVESHPEHNDLKKNWEFYLENPNPEPDFEEKLKPYINKELKVEDIKCFDPAMGSGHILVYMFDVLYEIYEKCGYMSREIPKLILENNLYGLDIDDRAYQIACFAVVIKGMKYNNKLLKNIEREGIKLNLASIQETNSLNNDDIIYLAGESSGENYEKSKAYIELFKNAKIYGSLININRYDKEFFDKRLNYIENNPADDILQNESRKKVIEIIPKIINQSIIMSNIYDILVTNPPYVSNQYFNDKLSSFINKNYNMVKSDIYSSFLVYGFTKVKQNSHLAFLTPYSWMFTSSYEELRKSLVAQKSISSLVQLEYNAFPEACVPACTFSLRNYNAGLTGEFIRLSDFKGSDNQPIKTLEAIINPKVNYRFTKYAHMFNQITGTPIAYWISDNLKRTFENGSIKQHGYIGKGLDTCDKDRFERAWVEVDINKLSLMTTRENLKSIQAKWFPFSKGGGFRKWYGNYWDIVNWENDGNELRNFRNEDGKIKSRPQNIDKYFLNAITWSSISSSFFGARILENSIYGNGASLFLDEQWSKYNLYFLSFLNSNINLQYMKFISPGLSYNAGDLMKVPIIITENRDLKRNIEELSKECIDISKEEWNSHEISWNFNTNELLLKKDRDGKIETAYKNYVEYWERKYYIVHKNEELINKLFISIYNLHGEVEYEVPLDEVTLLKDETKVVDCKLIFRREIVIKHFISYAIGCVLGRYSLDKKGLVYAGGNFDYSKYKSFPVDEDNIIPILSDGYFEDEIISRFVEIIKITFGEKTLSENLEFIAEILGKKSNETDKECIRRYFISDFYKDHLQTYKNRPIYWLFTSGKLKTFNCLIYMHRYDKTTLSRIRTDYLHELQDRLDSERKSLVDIIDGKNGDYSIKEKSDAKKKLTSLDKQIDELKKYDEVLHHMADMQIEIDLDDGVTVNYEKFKGLVAKIY